MWLYVVGWLPDIRWRYISPRHTHQNVDITHCIERKSQKTVRYEIVVEFYILGKKSFPTLYPTFSKKTGPISEAGLILPMLLAPYPSSLNTTKSMFVRIWKQVCDPSNRGSNSLTSAVVGYVWRLWRGLLGEPIPNYGVRGERRFWCAGRPPVAVLRDNFQYNLQCR